MPHLGEQINQETASSPTNSSTLGFVNAPYSPDELAQLLRDFRTNGYCILPDVFTIPTVAPFRRRVLAAATAASGAGDDIYHHPASVHLAMYFQDMEEALAPTQIVPGSHRDMSLYPTTVVAAKGHQQASQCPIKSFVIRAQDCVVWDQRCWHRRAPFSPRFAGDMRLLAIYGFNTIQQYPHWPAIEIEMPLALAHAWANAESPEDAAYWGGKWTARSILAALVQLPPEKLERIKAELAQLTTPD